MERRGWERGGLYLARCISVAVGVCGVVGHFVFGERGIWRCYFGYPTYDFTHLLGFYATIFLGSGKRDGWMWIQMSVLVCRAQDDGGGKREIYLSTGFCVCIRENRGRRVGI